MITRYHPMCAPATRDAAGPNYRTSGSVPARKLTELLGQRLLAFKRCQGHLRLEGRPVMAPRSLHRLAP